MTVIVWNGKTMAADRRATMHGTTLTVQKIWRLEVVPGFEGEILWGASGKAWQVAEMLAWFRAGRPLDKFPASQRDEELFSDILVIERDERGLQPGRYRVWHYQRGPEPFEVLSTPCAIGSGRDMALGAMHAGASAGQAVEICCEYESGCGEGVDLLTLDP